MHNKQELDVIIICHQNYNDKNSTKDHSVNNFNNGSNNRDANNHVDGLCVYFNDGYEIGYADGYGSGFNRDLDEYNKDCFDQISRAGTKSTHLVCYKICTSFSYGETIVVILIRCFSSSTM